MRARRICVVTGSRAEYGLLYWLLDGLRADPETELRLLVTGTHLAERFGHTVDAIEADGFAVDVRVGLDLDDDSRLGTCRALGQAVGGMAEALEVLAPDIVVVQGDRFEMLAAAQAALVLGIPVAHTHGGESTEGTMDDAIRHAITKMAHLHFVAAEAYARRVVQMGEAPERVFTVGAPGLDAVARLDFMSRTELEDDLGFDLGGLCLVVTYHPATLGARPPAAAAAELVAALDGVHGARMVFTGVNADPDNRAVETVLRDYAEAHPERARLVASLGQQRYLSLVRHAGAVVGNSSSGIVEAPALGTPTVNVGPRQDGRLRAASVIDCAEQRADIRRAVERAVSPAFRLGLAGMVPPYGGAGASQAILDALKAVSLEGLLEKRFHDLEAAR